MPEQKKSDPFFDLDWATLEEWAGTKTLSRGKEYQRSGRVDSLARSRDGMLVAWVNGSERYATAVYFDDGLVSECTCPVEDSCKHAVAVILEYLALCEKKRAVPLLNAGDSRLALLDIRPSGSDHPEEGLPELPFDPVPTRSPLPHTGSDGSRKPADSLRQYLTRMKKEELIGLIHELVEEFPDVEQEISDRRAVADSDARPLVDALLADIDAITQEEAWSNTWTGRSEIPDYTPVRKRMELLLSMGHPDVVVDAGSILLKKGTEQIEQSNDDDGETSGEIALCMDIVFDALGSSSRPDHERILFAINAQRADEFDLCGGADKFLEETWPAAAWSLVADRLLCELGTCGITRKDDFSERYCRDRITGWIITALDHAGREAEATGLCTAEAGLTDSYQRLVRRLLRLGKTAEAVEWIRRGIGATQKIHPGIARDLREIRRDVWENEGDWLPVAGLRAEEFLSSPSYDTYCQLKSAAEKVGMWDTVEEPVMQYLASGCAPSVTREGTTDELLVFGPLPISGLIEQVSWKSQKGPFFPVLIDHAIANRQLEEAVMWFDRFRAERARPGEYYPENKLWDAAADRFPERALSFWMACADREAQTAQPKGYVNAIGYLKKIRALMERQGRNEEWGVYLAGIRVVHARKKKFTGMIDVMEGKKILKS